MPDYILYKATVSVITPLHIGSGRELLKDYDYAVHAGQTWRINDSALLDAQDVTDPALAEQLSRTPPSQLLREEDYLPDSPFFRYVLPGEPRSQAEGARLREQIKTIDDLPYLPGSSLKGALRTALAWFIWGQKDLQADAGMLVDHPKFAAQNLEHQLFAPTARRGREPNHDLLKALQVSDSAPLPASSLMLVNASVLKRSGLPGEDIPIELEAVRPDAAFELTLKIDLALFSEWAAGHREARRDALHGRDWLLLLPAAVQAHTRARIESELAWCKEAHAARRLLSFYQQRLPVESLAPNQFFLQLGWGTGWEGKTFGSRLTANRLLMQSILANPRYQMLRTRRRGQGSFPASRRAAVAFPHAAQDHRLAVPVAPFGWVLVTLQPQGELPAGWEELARQATAALKPEPTPTAVSIPTPTVMPTPVPSSTPAASPVSAQPTAPVTPSTADIGTTPAAPAAPPAVMPMHIPKPEPERRERRTPPAPPPPPRPLLLHLDALPHIGDRFRAAVIFTDDDGTVYLELPGLSADDLAMALLAPKDNPALPAFREGAPVDCEVLLLQEEPSLRGHWLVRCRAL